MDRGKRKLEYMRTPTMHPRCTKALRRLIERRTVEYLWGQRRIVIPRLCSKIFGNGRKLLALSPIMYRPNYFVVRIDSNWSTSNWETDESKMPPSEWLDRVYDEIEAEFPEWPWARQYGLRRTEDDSDDRSSRTDWSDGSTWSEAFWPRLKRSKKRAGAPHAE